MLTSPLLPSPSSTSLPPEVVATAIPPMTAPDATRQGGHPLLDIPSSISRADAFAQRPSDILGDGSDIAAKVEVLRLEGRKAGLLPGDRYFVLADRLPDALKAGFADLPTTGLAFETLLRLPQALQLASAAGFVPSETQLALATRLVGITAAHAPYVEALHGQVTNYLGDPSPANLGKLRYYLRDPAMNDRIRDAALEAAVVGGKAPLSDREQTDLINAAYGEETRNIEFHRTLIATLLDFLDHEAEPVWSTLLAHAGEVCRADSEQVIQAGDEQDLAATARPDRFGLQVRTVQIGKHNNVGPSDEQVARLPTDADREALAREIYPELSRPSLHMAALDLLPYTTEIVFPQDPADPLRLRPFVRFHFADPACDALENRLRLMAAWGLLQIVDSPNAVEAAKRPTIDWGTLTIDMPASDLGSSSDVPVNYYRGHHENEFLDAMFTQSGIRRNAGDHFLPERSRRTYINAGSLTDVVEICHMPATVRTEHQGVPSMRFSLCLGLPASATQQQVADMQSALENLVGPARVGRTAGPYNDSTTIAVTAGAPGDPGSFDADGKPAIRCLQTLSRKTLETTLYRLGLAAHFDIRFDQAAECWAAVTKDIPAASNIQSLPMARRRDYTPLVLREGLQAALAFIDQAQAPEPETALLLTRYGAVLARIRTVQLSGDFGHLNVAVSPLLALHAQTAQRLLREPAGTQTRRCLETLAGFGELAFAVRQRGDVLIREPDESMEF